MAQLIPPPYIPYLANTALAIGCVPTAVGIMALTNPISFLQRFDFVTPSAQASPSDRKLLHGFIHLFGMRDIALGASTVAIWYHNRTVGGGDYRLLGVQMLIATGVIAVDGVVSRQVNGGGEWNHWTLLPVTAGLGLALTGVI